jgi:multiple sugar transport system ATP-binding protein
MSSLRLERVSKSFGNQLVLDAIDLQVAEGEFLVLVGPSGCGKSTLLRLIAGLESLSSGEIFLDDRPISHFPPKERNMAMVFQSYALYPHMTVYDNIAFGLRRQQLQGVPWLSAKWRSQRRQIDERTRAISQMLQIDHLLHRKPKDLSGGQKQRVALGRAIARNPQVFLMDEPLSNLDAQLRSDTRAQIVQLQKQLGITTLYVTHDQIEAMTMGDRIAVLHKGHLQQVDTPLKLYRQPANQFVASFLGSPPMNFLPVAVSQGQLVSPYLLHSIPLGKALPWAGAYSQLTLGIRPEALIPCDRTTAQLAGSISLMEALGAELIILIAVADLTFRAKVSADSFHQWQVGADSFWQIDLHRSYLFDPENQHTVWHPFLIQ